MQVRQGALDGVWAAEPQERHPAQAVRWDQVRRQEARGGRLRPQPEGVDWQEGRRGTRGRGQED